MSMYSEPYLIQSHTETCHDAVQQSKLVPSAAGDSCRAMEKVCFLHASQQGRGNDTGWGLTCGREFWVPSVSG